MTTVEALEADLCASAPAAPSKGRLSDCVIRMLDILIATAMLIFVAPTMILIAILIRLQDGGPALFHQSRIGRGGMIFPCLKFRSMAVNADATLEGLITRAGVHQVEWALTEKMREDPRVTPLGRLLRVSSLDELPQLLNVLRGDMSLVGPRPIVAAEVWRYGRRIRHYTAVRPGLTGLWQVKGRNDVSYRRRVAMDVTLVRRRSVSTYCAILLLTIPAVIRRQGVY
nr:sugar transferase [uncultured Brevundimonas sp.]